MKVVISIPRGIAAEAERHAKLSYRPLSHLYTEALVEYLSRHDPDKITKGIDAACTRLDQSDDVKFYLAAARQTLMQSSKDGGF